MSDQVSRFEDLERTDVLPQLGFVPDDSDDTDSPTQSMLAPPIKERQPATPARSHVAPFGSGSHASNGQLSTLPAKPSPTDLAVGGIRGKIADLENKLLEAQDHQIDLNRHCEQLSQKCRSAEDRAIKAEANYVTQSAELYRTGQRATDAEQRLSEQRARYEARIVDMDRQLLDARTRGDKRAESLELLLRDQSERTTASEQAAADLRIELERVRAEWATARESRQNLDERLAEQTQALESQLKSSGESLAKLQDELSMKLRHIAALEHGLEHRDRSIADLQAGKSERESAVELLNGERNALEGRCAELQKTAAGAQELAAHQQAEVARLKTALEGNDVRINELADALRSAEAVVRERDGALAEARAALQSAERQQTDLANGKRQRDGEFESLQKTMEKVMADRDRLDLENQSGRAELERAQARYDDAVKTIMTARETIAVREQQNASFERELRAATVRLDEAHSRIERAAAAAESFEIELRERDSRISLLEQKLTEHASALAAIGQDIERVNAASPDERLAAMGYALESLDTPGTIHRITRMTTTAGRSDTNDIAINSTSVSRFHARIVVKPEGVWLIDLQSTNGCGVNGRRTSRQILCDGDAVMIGHCRFRFSVLGAEAIKHAAKEEIPLIEDPLPISASTSVQKSETQAKHH